MSVKSKCLGAAAAALVASAAVAENQKVSFGTNWVAQAEHGGFYQAVADGSYADCGLDVTIIPGGPQVNNRALMLAGRAEFYMGGDLIQAFNAAKEGVPIVTVAAMFQKHPQVILAHPGSASSWEDLKGLKILIADLTYQSVYQWMMAEHGFTAEQRGLYTFNPAPFLADKNVAMQGYLSSEPFLVAKEGGFEPEVFLIADAGYSTYATTIETMAHTIENNPDAVQCFVDGSARGWYTYLYGDNTAANALIKEANPEMTDDKIAYAITQMKANGIVDSGDTETLGIGAITEEKVGDFYAKMVSAGVIEDGIDWKSAFTTRFANKGVGIELKAN